MVLYLVRTDPLHKDGTRESEKRGPKKDPSTYSPPRGLGGGFTALSVNESCFGGRRPGSGSYPSCQCSGPGVRAAAAPASRPEGLGVSRDPSWGLRSTQGCSCADAKVGVALLHACLDETGWHQWWGHPTVHRQLMRCDSGGGSL
jgi:hypothetical protein